jgi:hypothetical protein
LSLQDKNIGPHRFFPKYKKTPLSFRLKPKSKECSGTAIKNYFAITYNVLGIHEASYYFHLCKFRECRVM